ncbi:hypothetical protein [Streptomyces sp. NPDC093109]|uniref:hypothetical protein n=1 Tax=Streptomyces sp. NPDC093109 TaxID=3154977 RepID=UPI00344B81EB
MTAARQRVIAALTVDFGLDATGKRIRPPRARYSCVLCQQLEGPVYGAELVAEFVAFIRTEHPAKCTARSSA